MALSSSQTAVGVEQVVVGAAVVVRARLLLLGLVGATRRRRRLHPFARRGSRAHVLDARDHGVRAQLLGEREVLLVLVVRAVDVLLGAAADGGPDRELGCGALFLQYVALPQPRVDRLLE